jgi:hypothetical protein
MVQIHESLAMLTIHTVAIGYANYDSTDSPARLSVGGSVIVRGCLTRLSLRMGLLLHQPILQRGSVSPLELSHDGRPFPAVQSPSEISFDIRSGIDLAAQERHSNPIPF